VLIGSEEKSLPPELPASMESTEFDLIGSCGLPVCYPYCGNITGFMKVYLCLPFFGFLAIAGGIRFLLLILRYCGGEGKRVCKGIW